MRLRSHAAQGQQMPYYTLLETHTHAMQHMLCSYIAQYHPLYQPPDEPLISHQQPVVPYITPARKLQICCTAATTSLLYTVPTLGSPQQITTATRAPKDFGATTAEILQQPCTNLAGTLSTLPHNVP
eukprot:GHUV01030059.1.p1 GENE.GHUV01030059.1~~GHUV01030059.1.p1  ORF type:complete len:127 (+),score=28.33 GHUV01030059.1:415-795(+)